MRRSEASGARSAGVVVGGIVAGSAVAALVATVAWNRATARRVSRLETPGHEAAGNEPLGLYSPDLLAGLPEPVVRYFEHVLPPGRPLIRRARVEWEGEFRLRPDAKWSPFTATQHFSVMPPGFVWDARIRLVPLVPVRVRDEYVAGEGAMMGKIAALVPVVNQRGTAEMAAGALARYLGETMWFPTALLPSSGVSWEGIDAESARATLTDGTTSVSGDFRFNGDGEIVSVRMTRYRDADGHAVLTPFEATVTGEYRRFSNMLIPSQAEVAWVLPEGAFTYWRGRPRAVEYDPE